MIQVQGARLRSLQRDLRPLGDSVVVRTNIEQYIVDTIEIYARGSALFRFARGDEDYLPVADPTIDSMHSAAFALGIHDAFTEIWARIDRLYGEHRAAGSRQ